VLIIMAGRPGEQTLPVRTADEILGTRSPYVSRLRSVSPARQRDEERDRYAKYTLIVRLDTIGYEGDDQRTSRRLEAGGCMRSRTSPLRTIGVISLTVLGLSGLSLTPAGAATIPAPSAIAVTAKGIPPAFPR
jgi:hypothetical protein